MFKRHSSLVKHLDCGKHKRVLEHETLYDKAMIEYAINLECGASKCPTVLEGSRPSLHNSYDGMGTEIVKAPSHELNWKPEAVAKFQIGERTGKKVDPTEVSALKSSGLQKIITGTERLFISYGDFFTSQQISSYLSRPAAKRSVKADQHDSEEKGPGEDPQSVLSGKLSSEVGIQHSHPITYDSYNICELLLNSKLGSFSKPISYGISLNPLVSTYRKIRLEEKCHLRPCSQTRFNVVAVASAHNCIPLWHMLLLPCSLNLSYLATTTILVICWHRKHRTIWQLNLIKNNDGYFYMDKS